MKITLTDASKYPDVTYVLVPDVGPTETIVVSLTGPWTPRKSATADLVALLTAHAQAHLAGRAIEAAAKPAAPAALVGLVGQPQTIAAAPAPDPVPLPMPVDIVA